MPEKDIRADSILLSPDLAELTRGRSFVAQVASEAGFPGERVFDISVACSEAIANAIEHSPVKGEVEVKAILHSDRLEVEIQGPGEFQAPDRLGKRQTRGLGLPLMARLSDHLALFSGPQGETFVSLTFYRPGVERERAERDLDQTQRERTEQARHLDAFFENSLSPLVLLDRDFNFIRVNSAYARQTGRQIEEFQGRNHFELYPSDAKVIFEEVVRGKMPFKVEARPFCFPDHPEWGITYWDWTLTPLLDQAGEVEALVFALEDVTGRVRRKERWWLPGRTWLASAWPPPRDRVLLPVAIGIVLEILLFFGLSFLGSPRLYLGIPGPSAVLIGIIVAVTAGPLAGGVVALVGGIAFMGFLADFGASVSWATIAISIVLWMLVSIVAGYAAEQIRGSAASREQLLSQSVQDREALLDSLRVAEDSQRRAAEENARLYRQQREIAESLQSALLDVPTELGPVRVGHVYRSATETAHIGGDFYDAFEVKGDRVALLIGDVSGHGIEAARTATLVKDVAHAFIHQSLRPHQVLRRTNAVLLEKNLHGFVSLFLAILETETGLLRYACAGHPETLLKRGSGEIQMLGTGSPPLGVFPDARWQEKDISLEAGDVVLLYTDGVIETRRDGQFFGQKRLERLLGRKRITVERLPHLILDQLLAFSHGTLTDDVAVLALSLARQPRQARRDGGLAQGSLLD